MLQLVSRVATFDDGAVAEARSKLSLRLYDRYDYVRRSIATSSIDPDSGPGQRYCLPQGLPFTL